MMELSGIENEITAVCGIECHAGCFMTCFVKYVNALVPQVRRSQWGVMTVRNGRLVNT